MRLEAQRKQSDRFLHPVIRPRPQSMQETVVCVVCCRRVWGADVVPDAWRFIAHR